MNHEAFQHRSGRVISLARLSLACVFLIAIWADPSQPSRYPATAYAVLAAYAAISAAYLVTTWNNWWLEHRLAVVAHWFDIGLFGVMVYLTEGYTSPFFTFFVFIILSAAVRWSWRATAGTAAAIILVFFVAGLAATVFDHASFDLTRFLMRGTYLFVLSLLLIWFGLNQRRSFLRLLPAAELTNAEPSGVPPIRLGLEQAVARTSAKMALLIWWEQEEPWLNVARLESNAMTEERLPPGDFHELVDRRLTGCAFLFDSKHRRVLIRRAGKIERLSGVDAPFNSRLQARVDSPTGLAFPIETESHSGLFVLTGIPGLCTDDLEVAERLGDDFAAVLRRASMQNVFEQAAANRTRLSLARDLHDSVAQLLAGTSLRLEALRQAIRSGRAVDEDLVTLQRELRTEQRDLRRLIGQLRDGASPRSEAASLKMSVNETLERLSRQWGIDCQLARCPDGTASRPEFDHQIGQLIREAVANAAKHGGATRVTVSLDVAHSQLSLRIRDNGCGFPVSQSGGAGTQLAPWSLNERVHELGGTLMLASTSEGSEVTMGLPWREPS